VECPLSLTELSKTAKNISRESLREFLPLLGCKLLCYVGPCHHGMGRPQVAEDLDVDGRIM
jgi:hypothetical protein